MQKVPMTCRKTSDYVWALVMCGKNFRLCTGVEDVWEKLPITHGEVGIPEPQCGCGVNVKRTEEKEKMYIFYHIGNDKKAHSIPIGGGGDIIFIDSRGHITTCEK